MLALGALALNCAFFTPPNGWSKKWGPLVPHRKFPGDCGICHTAEGWDELRPDFAFDHERETGFKLVGAHSTAACLRCHNDKGPVEMYLARGCGGCHVDPHRSSLGLDCSRCHEQERWRAVGLVAEHARTRFPLFGVHAATPCERCHERAPVGDFRGAPVECDLCHRDDVARALEPNHVQSGWVRDCERCHTPGSWSRAGFSHRFFPLTQGHSGLDCVRCHTDGTLGRIPADCYSCHQADYNDAPNHVASGFSRDCTECHTTSGWDNVRIQHDFFPLTQGHAGLACLRCHTRGTPGSIPSDCNSCHQDDYERAPSHVALAYPRDCAQCHTTSRWTGASINHRFPLRGPHDVDCTVCHQGGNTSVFTCLVCHEHRQSEMDSKHREVRNYTYSSSACLSCHRSGRE